MRDARRQPGDQPAAEPDLRLGIEEVRGLVGHREIAELDQAEGAADAVAVDGGDDRLVHHHAHARHALPEFRVAGRVAQVRADREGTLAGAGQDCDAVVAVLQLLEGLDEFGDQPVRERIHLVGPVERDCCDTVFGAVVDQRRIHGCVLPFVNPV